MVGFEEGVFQQNIASSIRDYVVVVLLLFCWCSLSRRSPLHASALCLSGSTTSHCPDSLEQLREDIRILRGPVDREDCELVDLLYSVNLSSFW